MCRVVAGIAVICAIMIAAPRNTICVLASKRLGPGDARIVDELLDKATRIGISPPKVDPLGDYTVELYDRIGQEHAGAGAIMRNFGAAHRLQIRAEFGPSGRMRERIERGERVDLFASADIGHARALVEFGFASAMVMFAGDLMARSTVIDAPPGNPPPRSGDAYVDALQNSRIDLAIVYCSGRERYARLLPDAELIPFPPRVGGRAGICADGPEQRRSARG